MQYVSTRGGVPAASYSEIVLQGLARDGGLFVPRVYPQVSKETLKNWRGLSYAQLATAVTSLFAKDMQRSDIARLCETTYTPEVYCHGREGTDFKKIAPVVWLEKDFGILELSNGPTLAFKDMAMQYLGSLFEFVLARKETRLNILGATSGDTGSAAEYAMKGREGIQVFMLSPAGRMSKFQKAQMYSLQDKNIFNIAVQGSFDDAQDIVKAVSGDLTFKTEHHIGAVNSINWARIAAQVIYYFSAWLQATESEDEEVTFSVPSGNFGDVLAGWIAKQMGLPIGRLVVATNENDVLDEFFKTGVYRVRDSEHTFVTSSPSMDISKASNFERYIYDIVGRNAGRIRELWTQLALKGGFALTESEMAQVRESGFVSAKSTHADRINTIREVFEKEGLIVDPHTADGIFAARQYVRAGVKMLSLETALPAKFAATIQEAIGAAPEVPSSYVGIENREQHVTVMPADVGAVKKFISETLKA